MLIGESRNNDAIYSVSRFAHRKRASFRIKWIIEERTNEVSLNKLYNIEAISQSTALL